MNKADNLIEIIKKNNLQKGLFNNDWDADEYEEIDDIDLYLEKLGLRNFESVDLECNSDIMYSIVYFKDEDIYLKLIGEYDSYGSGNHYYYDTVTQVFPKQVTITKYE